jgi:hypothetical protein
LGNLAVFRCLSNLQSLFAPYETAAPNSYHQDKRVPCPILLNEFGINLPGLMSVFPEIVDENSLPYGDGKHTEEV